MSFKTLLSELEELQLNKSLPGADADEESEGDEEGNESTLGKSLTMTDEDGNVIEAVDGTELVKSLVARLDTHEASVTERDEDIMKSLNAMKDLVVGQSELIKSLTGRLDAMGSEGRGRRSVVTLTDKPDATTLQKSQPDGISADMFMAKAMEANKAGRLSTVEIAVIEGSLNRSIDVPADIVRKVFA